MMTDQEFLQDARIYINDGEIAAAHDMLSDPGLTLDKACNNYAQTRRIVVMALQGYLKEAVTRDGAVCPGPRYVDPWEEAAVIDHGDLRQLAAFAIYRTLESPEGEPMIFRRGASVH